jgi:hypothetical protein
VGLDNGGTRQSHQTVDFRAYDDAGDESTPAFRDWFMGKVREHTVLRDEQTRLASFAVVPDLDMAGARVAALAALTTLQGQSGDLVHR